MARSVSRETRNRSQGAPARPARRPRGLQSLLSSSPLSPSTAPAGDDTPTASAAVVSGGTLIQVPIDKISANSYQPRSHFGEANLQELSDSIRLNGILQPLVARSLEDGGYELIAGERRLRAARQAGLMAVPVLVREVDDLEMLGLSLIENIQRDDLNAIEAARGFRKLIDLFHLRQDEIAEKIGKSRSAIANTLRLLDLPQSIQEWVEQDKLSAGHARALLALPTASLQAQMAAEVIEKGLSVRELEALIYKKDKPTTKGKSSKAPAEVPPHIRLLQDTLSERFGTKVLIEEGNRKGRVVIEFYSNDDFERILGILELK